MSKEQFLKDLNDQDPDRLYLNINTKRTSIFFAQKLDEIEFVEQCFFVDVPSVVYEVQRREHLRYQFTPETATAVLIGLESDRKLAIQGYAKDISVGGICVEHAYTGEKISQRARSLEVGTIFPNLSFELYGKSIHCSAQLRWKKESTASDAIFLGLQFVKITSEDREGIRLFVMEESYDYIESILDTEANAATLVTSG
jgi:c-di-GMP-binding flagellar brake protein YcgR